MNIHPSANRGSDGICTDLSQQFVQGRTFGLSLLGTSHNQAFHPRANAYLLLAAPPGAEPPQALPPTGPLPALAFIQGRAFLLSLLSTSHNQTFHPRTNAYLLSAVEPPRALSPSTCLYTGEGFTPVTTRHFPQSNLSPTY